MNKLERRAKPEGRTVYDETIADPGESEIGRQRNIARRRAEGHIVYDLQITSPNDYQ